MKEFSAGGIIISNIAGDKCILLVEHLDQTYVFPKGHIKPGETAEQAAQREITEETGLKNFTIGERLGVVSRHSQKKDGSIVLKDIEMFKIHSDEPIIHSDKAEEKFAWLPIKTAIEKLRYQEDRDFLLEIVARL